MCVFLCFHKAILIAQSHCLQTRNYGWLLTHNRVQSVFHYHIENVKFRHESAIRLNCQAHCIRVVFLLKNGLHGRLAIMLISRICIFFFGHIKLKSTFVFGGARRLPHTFFEWVLFRRNVDVSCALYWFLIGFYHRDRGKFDVHITM